MDGQREFSLGELAKDLDALYRMVEERDRRYSDVAEERDRRYAEVALEREKALKIKEQADRDALDLARQIQTYKDEKANELREQIGSERGLYASKAELISAMEKVGVAMAPLSAYVATQQGGSRGMRDLWGWIVAVVAIVFAAMTLYLRSQAS